MTQPGHIQQPPGSSICGHCCVAMVLDVTVEDVIREIGHKHGTKPKELAAVLRNHGVKCADKRRVWRWRTEPLPARGLLALSGKKHAQYHWVLLWRDMIYDPSAVVPIDARMYVGVFHTVRAAGEELRITSYLEISDERH